MSIDACFILSAGYGTRMGEIGKVLPKPLWPLFNQTLLSATINFWRRLGVQEFYANVHHLADQMIPELEALGVKPVHEEQLLGSGGAFHHLKQKHPHLKKVLSVNCDNFAINLSLEKIKEHFDSEEHLIFAMPVQKSEKFNRLQIESNKLTGIIKNYDQPGYTYSGVGIINLEKLEKRAGESSFFDSVAKMDGSTLVATDIFSDFLDFGTAENYFDSSFDLIKNKTLNELLTACKIDSDGHIENGNIVYARSGKLPVETQSSILMGETNLGDSELKSLANSLIFNSIIQSVR